MDFDEYSEQASKSDKIKSEGREKLQFLVLGLNEEAGEIARLIKKAIRDNLQTDSFRTDLGCKLGDVLWYLNAIAIGVDLKLSVIADSNINFLHDRWLTESGGLSSPEHSIHSEEHEHFPEFMNINFKSENKSGEPTKLILIKSDGSQIGDTIDDNSYVNDGYRFHDVIHLALMAKLGWSPVMRKLLGLKRRENPAINRGPEIDTVEDGARAGDIEEAFSILIFDYMQRNDFLQNATTVDTSFLKSLRALSVGREVAHVPERMWELAILNAALVIRQLKDTGEGYVIVDSIMRQLTLKHTLG